MTMTKVWWGVAADRGSREDAAFFRKWRGHLGKCGAYFHKWDRHLWKDGRHLGWRGFLRTRDGHLGKCRRYFRKWNARPLKWWSSARKCRPHFRTDCRHFR